MEARERESILTDLGHADEEVRRLAVERLTTFPPAEAIAHLIESLGDASWRVRKAAIDRLAVSTEFTRAARALVGALGDGENPGRRNAALEALVRTGAVAIPILLEATNDPDVDVRKQVVDVLAGIGDSQSGPRLRELLSDEDANVRAAAADAIGAVGVADSTEELLAGVEDAEPLVRLSALRALGRLEVSLEVADVSTALDDPLLRPAAIAALGNSEDPAAFDTLTKALEANARSAREAAVEALLCQAARVGTDEVDRFAERLRSVWSGPADFLGDAEARLVEGPLSTRLALVQFLGLLRLPDTVAPLLAAGCDEAMGEVVLGALEGFGDEAEVEIDACWHELDPPARTLACQVMARTRGSAGSDRLRSALSAPDSALRLAATRAVGSRGCADVLADLVVRLEGIAIGGFDLDDEDETQVIADAIVEVAQAGGAGAAERAIAALAERLEGASEDFRLAATDVLGRVGSESDVPRIELLLSDPSDRVRRAATAALVNVAPGVTEPLRLAMADESATVRIGAAAALAASLESEVIADLAHLAEDEDPRVRAAAMRAVGSWASKNGDEAQHERALSLLAIGLRKGGAVAMATLEALARIGGTGVVPLARAALDDIDPEIVQAALTCVGEHGTHEDLQETIGLFSHASWAVRAQAVQVLAGRRVSQAVPAMLRRLDVEQDEFVRSALLRALETLERQAG